MLSSRFHIDERAYMYLCMSFRVSLGLFISLYV